MKFLFSIATIFSAIFLLSFSTTTKTATFNKFGIYIGGGTLETSPIQLKLNDDFSYTYMDISNSKKEIEITGSWEQDGNRIYLKGNEEIKFHNQWKIDPDCLCLKSKKGMTFYRLCQ